jgi:pimeloyl-ACP methyl ester carboxylesterase
MPSINVNDWEFAYDDVGEGPPVFLLHGLLMDRTMWDHQIDGLRDAYRCIALDAPGHGETPGRAPGFTAWDEAHALGAFADALDIGRAVWVGHSMGGFKALRLALSEPERVRALALVDSSPGPENPDLLPQYEAFMQVAKSDGLSDDLASLVAMAMFGPDAKGTPAYEHWTKRWLSLEPDAVEGTARLVFDRDDVTHRCDEISVPVLVMHGVDAIAIPLDVARRTATLTNAQLLEVSGSGHTSPVEKPEVVTRGLRAFLDGLPE